MDDQSTSQHEGQFYSPPYLRWMTIKRDCYNAISAPTVLQVYEVE